jgi:hypothetical protein
MGTLGQALSGGLGARGSKSSPASSPTGGGGIPGTTIGGQQIKASNVIQAIDNSTQQILGGLNILNDTFRMGLNNTTNQIQAQTSGINSLKRDTEDMVNILRDIFEQINLLNSKSSQNPNTAIAERVDGSSPISNNNGDILSTILGTLGPMLAGSLGGILSGILSKSFGLIKGGLITYLADMGLGMLGVGGEEIDTKQDDENWAKMNWWQKIESGMARTIENVGGFIAPNIANEAAAARIRDETQYFKDQETPNPNKSRAEAITQPKPKVEPPKKINRKGIFNKGMGGEYEGQTVEIISETPDKKAYVIKLPNGQTTQAGKRTLTVLDEQGSVEKKKLLNPIEEDIADLKQKSALINDFATRMGIDASSGADAQMEGNVPTSINGIPVPEELYTEEQKASIATARQMKAMMSGQSVPQGVQVAAAGATMGSGDYLVNRQRELDAQKETTSEGALRTQEQQIEEKVFEDLIPDLINFEAREVYYKADKITFDAGKIEFNEGTGGTGGEGGMAPAVPGAGADNFDRPGGTEARDGGGSDATKIPELSAETKAAADQLQKTNTFRVEPGKDDPLGQYSDEQLRGQGIVSHTNDDGTKVYSYAPGGIGSHADKIGGSGATETVAPSGKFRPVYEGIESDIANDDLINIIGNEATGSDESIDAVINNMLNRVGSKSYGNAKSMSEVAKQKGQYESWDFLQSGRFKAVDKKRAEKIRERMRLIASGQVEDPTQGANEFRASSYVYGEGRGKTFAKRAEAQGNRNLGGNIYADTGYEKGPYAAYSVTGQTPPASSNGVGPTAVAPNLVAGLQGMTPANAPTQSASSPLGPGNVAVKEAYGPGRPERPDESVRNIASNAAERAGMSAIRFTSGKGDWISPERRAGGQQTTQHSTGKALDVSGFASVEERAQFIEEAVSLGANGIGVYKGGSVHIDERETFAAWDLAKNKVYQDAIARGMKKRKLIQAEKKKKEEEEKKAAETKKAEDAKKETEQKKVEDAKKVTDAKETTEQKKVDNAEKVDGQKPKVQIIEESGLEATARKFGVTPESKKRMIAENEATAKRIAQTQTTADAAKAYAGMNNPTQRPYDVNNQGQGQLQANVPLGASADFGNKMAANKPMSTSDVIKSSMAMYNPTQRPYDVNNQGQGQMQANVPLGVSADFGNKMASAPPPAATPVAATPAKMDPTSAQSAQAVADLSRKTTMNREAASSQGPVQQSINNINAPKTPMQGEGPVDKNSPNPAITDHMDKYLAYMFGGTGATA